MTHVSTFQTSQRGNHLAWSCLTATAFLAPCHQAFNLSFQVRPPVESRYPCMRVRRSQVAGPD
ncbi:hypothetical protein PF005_g1741 [Phytophthora fragariae]|uniref:Uncharacterized protein n=1 Tax=Phytophthora fragariae TaxID=53985 RepID=A0A6A3FTJ3_9STRA|nr:hypothetical protein PF003_g34219 [Phytophthora fragariae]KAE8947410.1 hypothetical protein PF009_g2971 [Phytophthora fragariae]KAE8978460.1 hypothetical protein PF011_g23232 [Phytophthora fragariae]KAE9127544.1 hypothetical protein PF010_g4839 [Phytophthora fragariae]KAE9137113.1 hypothetical protein PF007_g1921 [Phytophthora fragariae]